ncbi:MAG: TRAP transporter small permease [Desulfobulbaceae bacterium]|nr:TRAP transporter small permease [Desulfobulbaceae bacterium]
MFGKIIRLLDKYFEEVLCAICLATMSSTIMFQVVLRYVFGDAHAWVEEISIIGMIGGVYFGAALAVRNKDHLRIVFVLKSLPKFIRTPTIILADLLWLGFIVFLLVQSIEFMKILFTTHYILPGLGIENRWPYLIIPIALVLMIIRMMQVYVRWITKKDKELI